MSIVEKIVALHRSLDDGEIPHAFGGALALAWCTERARGTIDIDLNVFVGPDRADEVMAALPADVRCTDDDLKILQREGQARLWWEDTPVDLFLHTTAFHDEVALRTHTERFGGDESVPFLGCSDLAVFKTFFNRPRDWADLAEMSGAGTLDRERVLGVLVEYLGPDDARVARIRAL